MQPTLTVTPPESMNPEWVYPPSKVCADRYTYYYHNRKLLAESESWSTWATRLLAKHAFSVVQTGVTYVYRGFTGFVAGAVVRNDLLYHAAGEVAHAGHGVFVACTRRPVDHDRTDKAVEKLQQIGRCTNPEAFIVRIQEVYNKWYCSSKGSSQLMKELGSDKEPAAKITAIVEYLNRPSPQTGFKDIRYNNGKELYQILVCMIEQSKFNVC